LHTDIADALEQRNQQQIEHALLALSDYTKNLADNVFAAKQKIKTDIDNQKAQSWLKDLSLKKVFDLGDRGIAYWNQPKPIIF